MTLGQMLQVLWRRKWLMLAIVVTTMAVTWMLLERQVPEYESTAVMRMNTVVAEAAATGAVVDVQVDFDPQSLSSTLMDDVADTAREPGATLRGQVVYAPAGEFGSPRILVTARGVSPEQAKERARAAMVVYRSYVASEIEDAVLQLTERRDAALAEAEEYQEDVVDEPDDSIAASRLQDALARYGALREQIRVIDIAGAPTAVVEPPSEGAELGASRMSVLALALAGGILAAIGAALLRDQFDHRIRGEAEVRELTGLPVLGELPYDRAVARRHGTLPVTTASATALGEGLRSLRSAVQVLLPLRNAAVVITSVEPSDGKSFVSANLALAWARAGKSVILVGGDLRRPSLATYFGEAADGPGLTELLQDALSADAAATPAAIEAALRSTNHHGLRILPSGRSPLDPADLLANAPFEAVVLALRSLADIVVIDSPPSLGLVDASLIASHADGVVVVSWLNRTTRGHLVETIEALRLQELPILGAVVNGVKRRHPRSYTPYYAKSTSRWRRPRGDELDPHGLGGVDLEGDGPDRPSEDSTPAADRQDSGRSR
ncbi:polysaccharide biosynthesis tyrosine autokinase [Demequina sp. NBRC 110053]|uniref:polysaccharide biosynthesis tyrosine autokinase n=1 Tax=Demequina sp. NBRC 110053 TaxID=1570342 RepID=UPI00118707F2|nr:polysaccharide biosynthesis tyrosine autokinase [Demequina sp. NBRC 110053]